MSQGKKNQYGRKEVGSFIRNRNVVICPLGALAHYFFVIFHILNRPFSSLQKKDWYDLTLLPGDNAKKQVSYQHIR
jgi:hypothetical protein